MYYLLFRAKDALHTAVSKVRQELKSERGASDMVAIIVVIAIILIIAAIFKNRLRDIVNQIFDSLQTFVDEAN